ncbi:T9SS type B sorting domain-containing protein [Galbibacter sp. PAP.153]|uniref:T9SS type B sorting domain-containing protein n=1 Tax=Galbibacter sp. PAP.153 TaxID=3104623 RepID=UPI0030099583
MALLYFSVKEMQAQTNALPNDCVNAITVCGSGMINSNADGSGVQEISNNACNSMEHNSLWLKINIVRAGTLGFTLQPTNTDIKVDYDFFVFGPNANCTNIGQSIRCSTTNPNAAGLTNNLTGMNGTATETSEGPGEEGDGFVKWLDVSVGDTYFIVIDRPVGSGGFNLEWTGSATTGGSPFPGMPIANAITGQEICNSTGMHTFDLSVMTNSINPDPNNNVSFYGTEGDAYDQVNQLSHSLTLDNSSQKIYARVTNANGCFDITDFELSSYKTPVLNNMDFVQCDLDITNSTDGKTVFNLSQLKEQITNNSNTQILYYESVADRTNNNPVANPENYIGQDQQVLYAKAIAPSGCESTSEGKITLSVKSTTASLPKAASYFTCDLNAEDTVLEGAFDLAFIKKNAYPNLDVFLYKSRDDAALEVNEITLDEIISESTTLFARLEKNNECQGVEEIDLTVNPTPQIKLPDVFPLLCLNIGSLPITAPSGFDLYKWYKIDENNQEKLIETQQTIKITEPGNYRLEVSYVYNNYGDTKECNNSKTFNIEASNIASILKVDVEDISENNKITILVEGEGNYEYALDTPYGIYQNNNMFENVPNGFIEVYVRDKNGCGMVSQKISVIGYDKFFTPNGDGYNDYWRIHGTNGTFQANSLIFIYDRYGKLIKQIRPLSKGWDGNYNGIPLPSSDYWFSATLEDGREFKGHFTLKR